MQFHIAIPNFGRSSSVEAMTEIACEAEELGFDGIATACVFAWEERARESSQFMLEQIRGRLGTGSRTADGALAAAASR